MLDNIDIIKDFSELTDLEISGIHSGLSLDFLLSCKKIKNLTLNIDVSKDDNTNYFELLREIEEAHNKVREKHFYMLAFIKQAEIEEDKKIKKVIEKKSKRLDEKYSKIFKNADMRFLNKYENKEHIQKTRVYTYK
jgi:GTPase involved in cell partitioning and DNA repair